MRFTSLLFLLFLPGFLFSQTAFEGNGVYVTNASYFVYEADALNMRDGHTLMVWEQRDTINVRSVWGHILTSDGELVNPCPIRFSNPERDASYGDICLAEDGMAVIAWFQNVGEDQYAVFAQKVDIETNLAWGGNGIQIGEEYNNRFNFDHDFGDYIIYLSPNDVNGFYTIQYQRLDNEDFYRVESFDENGEIIENWQELDVTIQTSLYKIVPDNEGGFWYESRWAVSFINRVLPDGSFLWQNDRRLEFPRGQALFIDKMFYTTDGLLIGFGTNRDLVLAGGFILREEGEEVFSESIESITGYVSALDIDENNRLYYVYRHADSNIRLNCWAPLEEEHHPWGEGIVVYESNEDNRFAGNEFIVIDEDQLTLFYTENTGYGIRSFCALRFTTNGEPLWDDQPRSLYQSTNHNEHKVLSGFTTQDGDIVISCWELKDGFLRNRPHPPDDNTKHFRLNGNGENIWGEDPITINLGDYDDPEEYQSVVTPDGVFQSFWRDPKRGIVSQRINEDGAIEFRRSGMVLVDHNNFTDWTVKTTETQTFLFFLDENAVENDEDISHILALSEEGEQEWNHSFNWDNYNGIPKLICIENDAAYYSVNTIQRDRVVHNLFAFNLEDLGEIWAFQYESVLRNSVILDLKPWFDDWLIIDYELGAGLNINLADANGNAVWDQSVVVESDERITFLGNTIYEDHVEIFLSIDLGNFNHESYGNLIMYDISRQGELLSLIEIRPLEASELNLDNCEMLRSPNGTIWIDSGHRFQALNPEFERLIGENGISTWPQSEFSNFCLDSEGGCWMFWSVGDDQIVCTHLNQQAQPENDFWNYEGSPITDPFWEFSSLCLEAAFNSHSNSVFITNKVMEYIDHQGFMSDFPMEYRVQLVGDQWLEVSESNTIPQKFEILSAFPNPFNSSTIINFEIPYCSPVRAGLYDISGRQLKQLFHKWTNSGNHQFLINGEGLSAGMYFVRLEVGAVKLERGIVLVK